MRRFLSAVAARLKGCRKPKKDDVFLVSYPKSGNTWVRFLIGNLLREQGEAPVDFHSVHDLCPEWERWDGNRQPFSGPIVFKSHQVFNPDFRRVIYIVRDPRDMYISYHKFSLPTLEEKWSLAEFIDRFESKFDRWSVHVSSWMNSKLAAGPDFLLIRYEDLLAAPEAELRRMSDFIGLRVSDEMIKKAVGASAFDSMKRIEKEKGRKFASENKVEAFVRKGQSGEWMACFGEAEWDAFKRREDADVMKKMGYSVGSE